MSEPPPPPPERLIAALAARYRIERELGSGGMATVYLARDLKHERDVAIKVLRPELAAALGAERFLSEIKTTARLQHPHILPLLDSGGADGMLYYVMPYMSGETLRARLDREKQLPVGDALQLAREVADALGSAHAVGIVHRDIKPENILLQGGHAVVADFGIALAVQEAGGKRMTESGLSLGTPQYMSPEQAMGEKAIDARSDIYALGAVTYEMLLGEPPFTGSSMQALVGRVLTETPRSLTAQRHTVPEHVEAAVLRALEKLPADRFSSAAAYIGALSDASGSPPIARVAATVRRASSPTRDKFVYGVLAGALALAAWGWMRAVPERETSRQSVVLWKYRVRDMFAPGTQLSATQAAIAPDGSSIVYADSTPDGFILMRKLRNEAQAVVVAGTQGGLSPFFSPDGLWIGFLTQDGKLRKVPVSGGAAITLAEDSNITFRIGTWIDDGTILYMVAGNSLGRVQAEGTRGERPKLALGSLQAIGFSPLPGSRSVIMTACGGNCAFGSSVYVLDLASDTVRELLPGATGAWYSSTGHLLYTDRDGGLFAMEFDPKRLAASSSAVPLLSGVSPAGFALSASGDALYSSDPTAFARSELVWVDRAGRPSAFDSSWSARFVYPALSPDGRTLAVSVRDATTDLWIHRANGSRQKVISPGSANWRPSWLPDGKSLVYASVGQRDGAEDATILRVAEDLGSSPELLLRAPFGTWEAEVSRDGVWMIVRMDEENLNSNLRYRRLTGDTTLLPLLVGPSQSTSVALSPDGRWLAYASNEGGTRYELYVAPFPAMAPKRLVSRGGGVAPRWSRNGRELFFDSDGNLMVVDVLPGGAFAASNPRVLFPITGYLRAQNRQQYDVAPDGRFIMIREAVSDRAGEVVYVENFAAEIVAKVRRR